MNTTRRRSPGCARAPFAQEEGSLKVQRPAPLVAGDQLVEERRLGRPGRLAQNRGVDRHRAPSPRDQTHPGEDLVTGPLDEFEVEGGGNHPTSDPVVTAVRDRDIKHLANERIGHLSQDARPVARVDVRTRRAPVLEILEDRQRVTDGGVGRSASEVRNHPDATGVMLE
jgi:hypothetical protein